MNLDDTLQVEKNVKQSGSSFYWGMKLLPKEKRRGMFAIYAFCREVDDIADDLKNSQSYQKGGLSGKPIELKSTELIGKFYNIFKGRIKIIGVGGVDSGKSAYEKFLAGANYVQLYTGMVFRGPNIVNLIKKELNELLLVDGVKNYSEIVGKTK